MDKPKHKYKVGSQVFYRHESEEIDQLRPFMYGEFWYRLKSGKEVCESQLKG